MFRRHFAALLACAALSVGFSAAARADGLIVISNPPVTVPGHFSFAPLQVVYHKVEAKINDQMAETSVDQEFYNPNGQQLEGDYIFPVPAGAQINKFTMDIDGQQVAAELLPADKARAVYNDIVRKSKDPALLEYAGRDMFRVHIFPIPANGKKQITLKYTELLKVDSGLMDYHYTLNTEKYSSKPLENVSIKVTINSSEPITTLYSPTHDIDKSKTDDGKSAVVGFEAKNVRPDRDFHLFIGHKTSPVGINLLTYRPDPTQPGYFVLLASPTVDKNVKPMPKDVVFVMDTSGSMAGEKIEQARKALKYCVDTLNPQDRFDVVRFSTDAEPLFGGLQPNNDDNRKKADDLAAGLSAAGGTALDEALTKALAEVSGGGPPAAGQNAVRMVVFMTDGQPTVGEEDPDKILAHAKAQDLGVRLFTFGVGTDVNTKLLDLMASASRGYSQYVLPQENLELSMSNFWGKVQDPIIAALKLDTGSVTPSKVYPKDMPDLFKGDQLVVFGTYDKPGKTAITVTGMVNGQQQKFTQDVTFEEKTGSDMEWIGKLWATRRVGYLLDEIRLHGENQELKDEIVQIARKWGVVTPYTAMLIIEDERARGVPLAQQSLREMEYDPQVALNVSGNLDSLRHGDVAGSTQAIANGINTAALSNASNLDQAKFAAEQDGRLQVANGGNGSAISKSGGGTLALTGGNTIVGGPVTTAGPQPGYSYNVAGSGGAGGGGFGGGAGGRGGGGAGGGGERAGAGNQGAPRDFSSGGNSSTFGGSVTFDSGALTSGSGTIIVSGNMSPSAIAAATAPAVRQSELNLGTNTANGWQTAGADGKSEGYRVVSNYAQQTRTINNRAFFLNGNQWTDVTIQTAPKDAKHVKIIFNSDTYFDLLAKHPDAAQYLSLGNNISLNLDGTIYDIVEEDPVNPNP